MPLEKNKSIEEAAKESPVQNPGADTEAATAAEKLPVAAPPLPSGEYDTAKFFDPAPNHDSFTFG